MLVNHFKQVTGQYLTIAENRAPVWVSKGGHSLIDTSVQFEKESQLGHNRC